MKLEEIKKAIENAKIGNDNSTEILIFFDNKKAYCVHGMNYGNGTYMVPTRLIPRPIHEIDELPKEVESMKAMWYHELMYEFGGLPEAMEAYK